MSCRCNCGYRCGGPGRCDDPECLTKTEGHFVRDCAHDFNGPVVEVSMFGGYAESVTCTKCGVSALAHDVQVGP